jgi:hypothetical protein
MAIGPGSSEASECSPIHSCHSFEAACKGPRSSARRLSRPSPSRRRAVPPFASTTRAVPHPNRCRPARPGLSRTRSGDLPCRAHLPAVAPSGAGRIRRVVHCPGAPAGRAAPWALRSTKCHSTHAPTSDPSRDLRSGSYAVGPRGRSDRGSDQTEPTGC